MVDLSKYSEEELQQMLSEQEESASAPETAEPIEPEQIRPKSAEKVIQKPIVDKNIKKNLGNIEAEEL